MSAPHVAGVAALYLQMKPTATPDQINYALLNSATASLVGTLEKNTPNRLLNIASTLNFTPVAPPPPYVAPPPLPPSPPPTSSKPSKPFRIISIQSIQLKTSKPTNKTWKADAVIRVYAINNGPLDEALVNASFTIGGVNLTCITNLKGACTVSTGPIANSKTSTTITINGVTGETLGYLKRGNKVTTVTVNKPK
jgi:hypothetical protein